MKKDGHESVSNTSQLAQKTCCTGGKYSVTSESDSMATESVFKYSCILNCNKTNRCLCLTIEQQCI